MAASRISLPLHRSLLALRIEFSSDYSRECGNVVLYESTASNQRVVVPRSRLFVQPNKIGTGGSSSLTVKPAQVAVFTDGHKGTALSLATAGAAASFTFNTRDEFFNMRSDQSVRADCASDADCTLSVRMTPRAPETSHSHRTRGGAIALHSANNFFNVAYTLTASGVYTLSVAAVYRLPSGRSSSQPHPINSTALHFAHSSHCPLCVRQLLGWSRCDVLQRSRRQRSSFLGD